MKFLFSLALMTLTLTACLYAHEKNAEHAKQTESVSWLTNFEEAKALAKKKSKPLFLYFSGSDWCGFCIKMHKEILDTKEFVQALGKDFIFVKVDFPKKNPLDSKTQKQNEELADAYNIRGFPTVIVLDPSLEKIGQLGYAKGGPQAFAEKARQLITK